MIYVNKCKANWLRCCHPRCDKDIRYICGINIIQGTIIAEIGGDTYCRGCIPKFYDEAKKKLNPDLWAFE